MTEDATVEQLEEALVESVLRLEKLKLRAHQQQELAAAELAAMRVELGVAVEGRAALERELAAVRTEASASTIEADRGPSIGAPSRRPGPPPLPRARGTASSDEADLAPAEVDSGADAVRAAMASFAAQLAAAVAERDGAWLELEAANAEAARLAGERDREALRAITVAEGRASLTRDLEGLRAELDQLRALVRSGAVERERLEQEAKAEAEGRTVVTKALDTARAQLQLALADKERVAVAVRAEAEARTGAARDERERVLGRLAELEARTEEQAERWGAEREQLARDAAAEGDGRIALARALEGARAELTQARAEIERGRAEAEQAEADHVETIVEVAADAEKKTSAAVRQRDELRAEVARSRGEADELRAEVARIRGEADGLRAEVALAGVERRRAEAGDEHDADERVAELVHARDAAEAALRCAREELEQTKAGAEALVEDLSREIDELTSARDDERKATAAAQEASARFEQRNAALEEASARFEQRNAALEVEAEAKRGAASDVAALRSAVEDAVADASDALVQLVAARSELSKVTAARDILAVESRAAGQQLARLREDASRDKAAVTRAAADLAEVSAHRDRLAEQCRVMTDQQDDAIAGLVSDHERAVLAAEGEAAEARRERDESAQAQARVSVERDDALVETTRTQRELARSIATMEKKVADLEAELDASRTRVERAAYERQELVAAIALAGGEVPRLDGGPPAPPSAPQQSVAAAGGRLAPPAADSNDRPSQRERPRLPYAGSYSMTAEDLDPESVDVASRSDGEARGKKRSTR